MSASFGTIGVGERELIQRSRAFFGRGQRAIHVRYAVRSQLRAWSTQRWASRMRCAHDVADAPGRQAGLFCRA